MKRARLQQGAALLSAMLVVALVATLASAALWLQWRQVEVEIAERGRAQSQWLLTGAMDWTRLILSEDARSAQTADHLGEPWALPVQESKLSTFLSQDHQWREGDPEVFLSGQIIDAQSRLNLMSLLEDGKPMPAMVAAWQHLFERLDLPMSELQSLLLRWPQAVAASRQVKGTRVPSVPLAPDAPLQPQRFEQLVWLGLSPQTLERLRPYATVLPTATPVNLNTAPEVVLEAIVPGLDAASARQWVQRRNAKPWMSLQEASEALGGSAGRALDERLHAIRSRYFEVHGRLRVEQTVQNEWALVEREGGQTRMLWRARASGISAAARSLQ
jgi:general secretion pathway protein K